MNKTLSITTIVLVAVVMGMSAVAPMLPVVYAHNVPDDQFEEAHLVCLLLTDLPKNVNKFVCNHD